MVAVLAVVMRRLLDSIRPFKTFIYPRRMFEDRSVVEVPCALLEVSLRV